MSSGNPSIYFVHTLVGARDWQDRPQFDDVCDCWQGNAAFRAANERHSKATFAERNATVGRGVCALVGMGGAGKTAIADRFRHELPVAWLSRARFIAHHFTFRIAR